MPFAGEIRHNHACLPASTPMAASVMLAQKFRGRLLLNWTEWGLNADPSHHPTVYTSALESTESRASYISPFSHVFPKRLSWDRHLQHGSGETLWEDPEKDSFLWVIWYSWEEPMSEKIASAS